MEVVLEILKKHVISIVCGVIALIAIVALFWPIDGMYTDFKLHSLDDRKKAYDTLDGIMKRKRTWPITVQGGGGSADLKLFPNDLRIAVGKEIKDKANIHALEVQRLTIDSNKHVPLVDGILPKPSERRFEFRDAYQKMVSTTLLDALNPRSSASVDASDKDKAEPLIPLPPTEPEVHAEADRLWNTQYKDSLIFIAGKPVNYDTTVASWHEAVDGKLEQKMRLDRAQNMICYVSADALAVNKSMLTDPTGPKENEIWYAQNMLWVEKDVIDGIVRLNKAAKNVMEATVKHVIRIDVPEDNLQYVLGEGFGKTPTGRGSNTGYDVLQFTMTLNVDARKIPAVITELERNKMITITQAQVLSIDGTAAAEEGYIYGDVPVVRLTMRGEEIFLRDWTVPLMPATIKTAMNIP